MLGATRRTRRTILFACALVPGLAGGGCAFGPRALERSHGRYNEAVRRVDEEQLLRNLVHIRYNETPLNLNVASIAAQYELAGGAEARPFFGAPNPAGNTFHTFTSILPDANISGANRPTLTLIPSDNGDAMRRFLTPISAETMLFLTQTSWPVSTVLRLWVERLNGVPNAATASGPQRDIVPDFGRFRRAIELIQSMQDRGLGGVHHEEDLVEVGGPLPPNTVSATAAVEAAKNGLEYRPRADGTAWSLVRRGRRLALDVAPSTLNDPDLNELVGLLNLEPGRPRYDITVFQRIEADPIRTPSPPSSTVRLSLRSTAQVYFYLANGVEVPCEHLVAGLVRLPAGPDGKPFDGRAVTDDLFTVHACRGHKPPAIAFVAVKYRDYWYYIDDRDQASKATFALMLQLSRLDFAHQQPGGPLLTLPVGR